MVPNDRPLMQVASIDPVIVELMAEAADLPWLQEGQQVALTSSALPHQRFSGTVNQRSLGAYPVLNQFRVVVTIPNPDHLLLPGLYS